jgi:membrane-bound ClpP family serine protease
MATTTSTVPILTARGRIAWILAMILGVILFIVGATTHQTFFLVAGILFFVFGLIFLILSLATKGRTD